MDKAITPSPVQRHDIAELTQAFELFTHKTAHLEQAYQSLKEQFRQVNTQLAAANQALTQKVSELDAMTSYLNGIVANMSQGLLFVNRAGLITTYNPAAEKILGRKTDEVLGRPFNELFTFSLEESGPLTYGTKQLEVSSTAVEDEQVGRLLLIRDVTELLYLQTLTQRQDRLKDLGEMAACVAHEIRNPLGGIEGWASLLKRDVADRPDCENMAERIIQGVRTLNRLVSNILHYSRPVELHMELTDLSGLLKDIVAGFRLDPQCRSEVILTESYAPEVPAVPIDRMLFKAIILNLLLNAYQAVEKAGNVTLTLACEGDLVLVGVSDDGCGIAIENIEKIFSPFFTTKQEGNGFGLSEVHRCIQVLGGQIDVESQLGVGTRFTMSLPRHGGN